MKAIVNLLMVIVGAQLAIGCRGMDRFWNPTHGSEDILSGYANWSGEENRLVQQHTASGSLSQKSLKDISSSLMDDVQFSASPREVDTAQSSGQSSVHQLVFDKAVFATPPDQDTKANDKSRLRLIENEIDKSPTSTLIVPIEAMQDFLKLFHSPRPTTSQHTPSQMAAWEMDIFLTRSAEIWKTFYQKQLGINFISEKKWFLQILDQIHPNQKVDKSVVDDLVNFFLCYIFFVDMILTTIRKPTYMAPQTVTPKPLARILPPSTLIAKQLSTAHHSTTLFHAEHPECIGPPYPRNSVIDALPPP
ncbi:hypothetical protein PCANC_19257, partial [Puccinia coronata f. sp. avenae]